MSLTVLIQIISISLQNDDIWIIEKKMELKKRLKTNKCIENERFVYFVSVIIEMQEVFLFTNPFFPQFICKIVFIGCPKKNVYKFYHPF